MKSLLLALLIFLAFLLLASHELSLLPDGRLHLSFLDVGQGDAILVTTPDRQRILIDGGPDATVLERLGERLPFFDKSIDLVLLTHTDDDHLRGLIDVLQRYDVRRVLMTGVAHDSATYTAFLHDLALEGSEVLIADAGHDLSLGDGLMLDILWPEESLFGQKIRHPNDASIVAKLIWNGHAVLLPGDLEEKGEEELLKEDVDLHADILKVPHHGSRTSSSTGFLLAVAPDRAIVSVGSGNTFGHPHPDILARYTALGIPIERTDEEGAVEVVWNW